MENLEETALKVYDAIFHEQKSIVIDEVEYFIWKTSKSKLRYVTIAEYSFIEQNPNKGSRWAKMAQAGHQILWIRKGTSYIANVRDRKFFDLRRKSN